MAAESDTVSLDSCNTTNIYIYAKKFCSGQYFEAVYNLLSTEETDSPRAAFFMLHNYRAQLVHSGIFPVSA